LIRALFRRRIDSLFADGRDGVRTRWPYEAVERARFVMKMKAQGHPLDEIADMIRAQ